MTPDAQPAWRIRQALAEDIRAMALCRQAMFRDMGVDDMRLLDSVAEEFSSYAEDHMVRGEYLGWLAEAEGVVLGSIGALTMRFPPSVRNVTGTVGYIMNLYVAPSWRRRGLATALVTTAVDRLAEDGVSVVSLHASDTGRPLYEKLGFEQSSEMRLFLGERQRD